MRLPAPAPAVKRALAALPHAAGVYLMRDVNGRVVYVGRSRDLAGRTRSYWTDLGDRPHLRRMIEKVAWLEPVLCESEHEAAFLESDLLERHPTRYNRTLGMESCVWLRLDAGPAKPDLEVRHEPAPRDGARWFGPYLGWEPVRQAAAGLARLFPIRFTGTPLSRSDRELAHSLGVGESDRQVLARRIEAVLDRDGPAVRSAMRRLEAIRDRASANLAFEHAAAVQEQMRGLSWIGQPQKLAALDAVDSDHAAAGGGVEVVISLRRGRMAQRRVGTAVDGRLHAEPKDAVAAAWTECARRNAELLARLMTVDAVGPLTWRPMRAGRLPARI